MCQKLLNYCYNYSWCLELFTSTTNKNVLKTLSVMCMLILSGCCASNSTPTQTQIPLLPTLQSIQPLTNNGNYGVWMSAEDAEKLSVWIYQVTGSTGD